MSSQTHRDQVGGASFHVGDCYIWAAIHYLDSVSDYKECLPCRMSGPLLGGDDLVMLDDVNSHFPFALTKLVVGLIAGIILAMAICLMFY
jgi:hypothetical protein